MFFIRQIVKLIRLLHQNEGALLLSVGFSLGLFSGLCGWASILGALSAIIAIFFRVQLGAYLLGTATFTLLALPLIGVFHKIGLYFLSMKSLESLWTAMYAQPVFHWVKFNHTVTLGASAVSVVLFPVVLLGTYAGVKKYQQQVLARLKNTRTYKAFIKSTPVLLYLKYLEQLK